MFLPQSIKIYTAKILFCVYVFALFKPISPILIDVFEHTFLKAKHMATMHFKHGHHHHDHLHEELVREEEDHDHEAKGNTEETLSFTKTLEVHLAAISIFLTPYFELTETKSLSETNFLEDIFIQKITPPPKT